MCLRIVIVAVFLCESVSGRNFIKYKDYTEHADDDGPLFLTPLIEKNQTEKARNLSEVDPTLFAGVKSYAAYITVNKTYNSNTFFWYFPTANPAAAVEDTPWLIWLQGGPGGSSMYGLFVEIGPIQVSEGKAHVMPVTWGGNYSLLFIDNPVGTGFSFTNKGGYATNEDMVGSALLNFLQQFLQVFPELRKAPLFLTGESYAGKYIPAFGHYIHNNQNDLLPINLKGLAIGDGATDPPLLLYKAEFALQVGLVSPKQAEEIDSHEEKARKSYAAGDFETYAKESNFSSQLLKKFAPVNFYNYLRDGGGVPDTEDLMEFLNRRDVQKALHVGYRNYSHFSPEVNKHLLEDFYHSVKPWLEELIDHYQVMCYNGQLDVIIAYALSVHTYHSLKWSKVDEYLQNERIPLLDVNDSGKIIGFIKEGGNFMDVMIRGSGHMVPHDQPAAAKQMIDYFIKNALNK